MSLYAEVITGKFIRAKAVATSPYLNVPLRTLEQAQADIAQERAAPVPTSRYLRTHHLRDYCNPEPGPSRLLQTIQAALGPKEPR